jgi:acetyl esterase/lipase
MNYSLTYYITLFIIKIKGIKRDFSQDPIDFKKIRKEDIHHPKGKFYNQSNFRRFKISNSLITEVVQNKASEKLLIFIHGGAFISGPASHHWETVKSISEQSNHTIWMCDYPKAPENKISEISKNIDLVYKSALENYSGNQISLIGDSVGGTLIAALIQRLVLENMVLPKMIFLISPVMDASMSNPQINEIDPVDPMLSKIGVLSAKKMCAENNDLTNVMISPINGSFDNFPKAVVFLAQNDITSPDQVVVVEKLRKSNGNIEVIEGKGMPHIWPFLPIMRESKVALAQIIDKLNRID